MRKNYDLIGTRFGRLLITGGPVVHKGNRVWQCHTSSCGCGQRDAARKACRDRAVHNASRTRLYVIWRAMHQRCEYPRSISYQRYGGRGIRVCADWALFERFRLWAVGSGYSDSLSIERRNNDGNYEPTNCCWATVKQQAANRRSSRIITIGDKTLSLEEWSSISGVKRSTLAYRLDHGISPEKAIIP